MEESKTRAKPKDQSDGWGETDLQAKKQPSEEPDLGYLKTIKR